MTRPPIRFTYTYVLLEVSQAAYDEIAHALRAAEYDESFFEDDGREGIDMHGIALVQFHKQDRRTLMVKFKYALSSTVTIVASGESGRVIARAEYETNENQYLVRYKCADGRAVESWWTQSALTGDALDSATD